MTTGLARTRSICAATRSRSPITSGSCLLTLGEVIGCDFSAYPNVKRWLDNMKRLSSWPQINEALYGYAEAVKGQPFVRI